MEDIPCFKLGFTCITGGCPDFCAAFSQTFSWCTKKAGRNSCASGAQFTLRLVSYCLVPLTERF